MLVNLINEYEGIINVVHYLNHLHVIELFTYPDRPMATGIHKQGCTEGVAIFTFSSQSGGPGRPVP